jgi:hypothetical protein
MLFRASRLALRSAARPAPVTSELTSTVASREIIKVEIFHFNTGVRISFPGARALLSIIA